MKTKPTEMRIVSGLLVRSRAITYGLKCGEEETWHQDFEITTYPKVVKIKGFYK